MPLSPAEKEELRGYILGRACAEFRRGQPCLQRKTDAEMIGERHASCVRVEQMLALVAKA